MRILITNDDGMNASQLPKLIAWAKKLGEVTVVVPKVEQSAKSHGIEIHKPFEAKQVTLPSGDVVWAVDSTPADCVRFAKFGLKLDFDLVFSGVNRGLNIGTDTLYSGTVSAASEAVLLGMKAVALSTNPTNYDKATEELDRVWAYFQENKLLEKNSIYNVNIPGNPGEIRITHQGGPYYSDEYEPMGNDMYLARGINVYTEGHDYEIDTNAALHGYISISPLTICRTDLSMFEKLK